MTGFIDGGKVWNSDWIYRWRKNSGNLTGLIDGEKNSGNPTCFIGGGNVRKSNWLYGCSNGFKFNPGRKVEEPDGGEGTEI